MVPLRLSIKNFMCYRSNVPELDLEGLHVACLCGDNGHGKTALFDAITWVLWGQSRAHTQDELVHQGEQDMAVELVFKALNQRYRVSRRHSKSARSSRGSTLLELQVSSNNGYQAITGNSIRETEAQIKDILHLDYDTFINTAFLVQGQADMFTSSTPAKRKETLAEVLDLEYYDRLEHRAKDRSRLKQNELQEVEIAITMHQTETGQANELQQRLDVVNSTLDSVSPKVDEHKATVDELQTRIGSLSNKQTEMELAKQNLLKCESEAAELSRQVNIHQSRISEYESSVAKKDLINQRYSELKTLRAEIERLTQVIHKKSVLDTQKAQLEKEVAVQKERLSGKANGLQVLIDQDLKPRIDSISKIEERQDKFEKEQNELTLMEQGLTRDRERLTALSANVKYLKESNDSLHQSMEETRNKFDLLDETQAECPLCKQPLGTEGRNHLAREYEAQGQHAKLQFQSNKAELHTSEIEQVGLTDSISAVETDLKSRTHRLQSELAKLNQDKNDTQRAQTEMSKSQVEFRDLRAQINAGRFAESEKAKLAEVEEALKSLGYDDNAYTDTQEKIKESEPYANLYESLTSALRLLPEEREALTTSKQLLKRRNLEATENRERFSALQKDIHALPRLQNEMTLASSIHQKIQAERDEAMVERAVLQDKLDHLTRLKAEMRIKEESLRRLRAEKSTYDELATAFGKNGIQALIIGAAIPQLEDDSNKLLGRLTENRMFLKLELQQGKKDSKTGLPSESLQVLISDEVGTRSYETFSGGEAFRINFALRIALSKLLARRSGAPLPILFIDEGFGTQDAVGQERLKEAIQSIQNDFEKIIVITHVEQIKESFPVRIEVSKIDGASTFSVV